MKEITINRELRKYSEGLKRNDTQINTLVVHGAGIAGSAKSVIKWMAEGGIMPDGTKREAQYKKAVALFHYIIDRDGSIIEVINPHNTVYHSSTGHFDTHTIGVELINGTADNSGLYTVDQYQSLTDLVFFLNIVFNDQITTVIGHGRAKEKYGNGQTKACPGSGFKWEYFKSKLLNYGYGVACISDAEIKLVKNRGLI